MLSHARSLFCRRALSSGLAVPHLSRCGFRALCSSSKSDEGAAAPESTKEPPKHNVIWQLRNLVDVMPEPLKKAYSRDNMYTSMAFEKNQNELNQLDIHEAMYPWQLYPNDTGSTPVQIAILTKKIEFLANHMGEHKQDTAAKRFMQMRVSERSKLLKYLRRQDRVKYEEVLEKLNIRRAKTFDPLVAEAKKRNNQGPRMLGKRR